MQISARSSSSSDKTAESNEKTARTASFVLISVRRDRGSFVSKLLGNLKRREKERERERVCWLREHGYASRDKVSDKSKSRGGFLPREIDRSDRRFKRSRGRKLPGTANPRLKTPLCPSPILIRLLCFRSSSSSWLANLKACPLPETLPPIKSSFERRLTSLTPLLSPPSLFPLEILAHPRAFVPFVSRSVFSMRSETLDRRN